MSSIFLFGYNIKNKSHNSINTYYYINKNIALVEVPQSTISSRIRFNSRKRAFSITYCNTFNNEKHFTCWSGGELKLNFY